MLIRNFTFEWSKTKITVKSLCAHVRTEKKQVSLTKHACAILWIFDSSITYENLKSYNYQTAYETLIPRFEISLYKMNVQMTRALIEKFSLLKWISTFRNQWNET